ncbi:hypothetical protein LTS18_006164 [Coniosporium uncinatum]|uniref:Uncharacterized protein n=1 Tax=Coniosporium uncinatum TaxID=93489 RepID=A0ACC3DDJ1_9PEZI|nr:hypothetical protein LTS18_006164 [Coniosporium uncinatum]
MASDTEESTPGSLSWLSHCPTMLTQSSLVSDMSIVIELAVPAYCNGPSALILSYILHGHIPYYKGVHHDGLLHSKVSKKASLLDLTPDLYAHFGSSLRYSTQALPINTLLDTLIRPNADTEVNPQSHVEWRHEPERAVSHIALGGSSRPGGQWADNPVTASWDIGTLSYAEMLSLPGYTFSEHYNKQHKSEMPDFRRPSRAEVADYLEAYPDAVGISDAIRTTVIVKGITRVDDGFLIGSHNIRCKHLVLASGIFSINLPPPPLLEPLASFTDEDAPLLVIGSGFSAADVIISTSPHRKILHLFQWHPEERPSPLRGCHHQAYPEYAGVYRQMKLAAMRSSKSKPATSPMMRRRKSNPFFSHRDWETVYEGCSNAEILDVVTKGETAIVRLRLNQGEIVERTVGALCHVVGRRGTLEFLSRDLLVEILDPSVPGDSEDASLGSRISGRSLRAKVEEDLEVAQKVFVIGSLAGDSLIRHAFGACVYAAGRIIREREENEQCPDGTVQRIGLSRKATPLNSPRLTPHGSPMIRPNGTTHEDLHLDRRKLVKTTTG